MTEYNEHQDAQFENWLKRSQPPVDLSERRVQSLIGATLLKAEARAVRPSIQQGLRRRVEAWLNALSLDASMRFGIPALAGLAIGIVVGNWMNVQDQTALMAYLLSPTLGLEGL